MPTRRNPTRHDRFWYQETLGWNGAKGVATPSLGDVSNKP